MNQRVGIGTRSLNCVVDTILVFLLAYATSKTWNWYVLYWRYPSFNFGWFFFGSMFVYYFLFEGFTGRTPGKWLSLSKVVNEKGKRPGILQVFLRSLARVTVIDLFFIPFTGKTLHDLASKTDVVEA
jgi:uncharacterized RDD family membrane protein YckC